MGAENEIFRACFTGKTVTIGPRVAWTLRPSGAGPARTVLHSSSPVERERSRSGERVHRGGGKPSVSMGAGSEISVGGDVKQLRRTQSLSVTDVP